MVLVDFESQREQISESKRADDYFDDAKAQNRADEFCYGGAIGSVYGNTNIRFVNAPIRSPQKMARVSLPRWILFLINGVVLLSLSIVVSAVFVFLSELSQGESAFLLPSFSAVLIFSIVLAVALKLVRAVKALQNGS